MRERNCEMENFIGETIKSVEPGYYSNARDEDGLYIIHTLTLNFVSGKKMIISGESVVDLDLDTDFESLGYREGYNNE
jgi:hypothetical protein